MISVVIISKNATGRARWQLSPTAPDATSPGTTWLIRK